MKGQGLQIRQHLMKCLYRQLLQLVDWGRAFRLISMIPWVLLAPWLVDAEIPSCGDGDRYSEVVVESQLVLQEGEIEV